jgi:hypothetical protein
LKKIVAKKHGSKENRDRSTYELTYKDVVDVLEVIDNSPFGELQLELEDLKLTVVKREGYGFSATARSSEIRNIQHFSATTKNEASPSIKEEEI